MPRNFESTESVSKTLDYIMNQMMEEKRAELESEVDLEEELERIVRENNNMLLMGGI